MIKNKVFKNLNALLQPKIFCISLQRTGTTSVGRFFREHEFKVATYRTSQKNDWTHKWFMGNFNEIFQSKDFRLNQVFEDDPWWCVSFYRYLFFKFPKAKFILFERDQNKWFDSMMSHSNGKTLGNTHIHSSIYRREVEFIKQFSDINLFKGDLDNLLSLTEKHREHYTNYYLIRNAEVKAFFKSQNNSRLVCCNLEDPEKWQKLANFFDFKIDANYEIHANKS